MSFSQMINILRQKHKEEILLINVGAFYIAIEEDAVLLNNKLKLKCSCFQKNTCKVGVPINSLEKIKEFLKTKLELELNSKTQIFKNKQGVNFCGYKINEYRLKIRDKGKGKLKKKVKELKYKIKQGEITSKEAKRYLAGHLGYIKIANTYTLEQKLFEK